MVSGTMANLIGLLCHCGRGDEAIMGDRSHTFLFEAGSASAVGSIHPHILPNQPDGTLLGKHRKLKPTGAERLIWGEGDGSTLTVLPTPLGKIGGLICWENYMPLARMAMYSKGVDIYLAPTADARWRRPGWSAA